MDIKIYLDMVRVLSRSWKTNVLDVGIKVKDNGLYLFFTSFLIFILFLILGLRVKD